MSALTMFFTRASGYSTRGVFFQLQTKAPANKVPLHAMRKKSFDSGNPPSLREQFKKNMPWFGKLYGMMFATATGSIYITGWVFERAQKVDTLAKERHIDELAFAIKETALAEERTLKEIALAKAETSLVKDRAKAETALVAERAKADT